MAETPCLCGSSTVRKGSFWIGRLQFWLGLFVLLLCLIGLSYMILSGELKKEFHSDKEMYGFIMEYGFLFVLLAINVYLGHILMKATVIRNLLSLQIWLITHIAGMIFSVVTHFLIIIIMKSYGRLPDGVVLTCISVYMWIVVYDFYKDELLVEQESADTTNV